MVGSRIQRITTQIVAGLALAATIVVPAQAVTTPAPGIVVSGRVTNTSTGRPISGVTIITCTTTNAVTDTSGHWQILIPTNTLYCARIGGGVPSNLIGPVALSNNREVKTATTYEHQQAGLICYRNTGCAADLQIWDRSFDGNVDFAFRTSPVKMPVPAPAKPATPAPTSTPTATSVPSVSPTNTLTRPPSSSPKNGPAANSLTVSFASSDQIATVAIPVGSIPDGAICIVKLIDPPVAPSGKSIVAGSYLLSCMTSAGQVLPLNGIAAAWQLHLKDVIKDLGRPKAEYTNGTNTKALDSSYDTKSYVLGFKTAATNSVLAVASPKSNLWVSLLVIGFVILVIIMFLLFFPIRGHRRRSYQEYLRSKYYNL